MVADMLLTVGVVTVKAVKSPDPRESESRLYRMMSSITSIYYRPVDYSQAYQRYLTRSIKLC